VVVYSVKGDGGLDLISSLSWADRSEATRIRTPALPLGGRKLLVVTDEAIEPDCQGARKDIHLVDISDETRPRGSLAVPRAGRRLLLARTPLRSAQPHENRPGTFSSDRIVFATYFNAGAPGLRQSDPARPAEIASYVPEPPAGQQAIQFNDVLVGEDGLIFVTDRLRGGLYILRRV